MPTSASHGTSVSPDWERAAANTSSTVAASSTVTVHSNWREGVANATMQVFMA